MTIIRNLSEALERINGEILEIEDTGNETGELYVLRRELAEIESKLENIQEEVNQVKNIAEIFSKEVNVSKSVIYNYCLRIKNEK